MKIYYYGCLKMAGHYFWNTNKQHVLFENEFPHPDIRGLPFCPLLEREEGKAKLTHYNGWTILGWRDNTVDVRPGSHSNLCAEGTHSFEEMLAIGQEHFPEVMSRQHMEITLVETT